MTKLNKFFNIFSIIVGVIIIIYIIYGFISSLVNPIGLPSTIIFQLAWFGLGVVLISDGFYRLKKQDSVSVIENNLPDISYKRYLILLNLIIFTTCLIRFIIVSSDGAWDIGMFLVIYLFGFQLPLALTAFFTRNKNTLNTVSILSVFFGVATFLI